MASPQQVAIRQAKMNEAMMSLADETCGKLDEVLARVKRVEEALELPAELPKGALPKRAKLEVPGLAVPRSRPRRQATGDDPVEGEEKTNPDDPESGPGAGTEAGDQPQGEATEDGGEGGGGRRGGKKKGR